METFEECMGKLKSKDVVTRLAGLNCAVATALGELGDKRAINPLDKIINRYPNMRGLRQSAKAAIAQIMYGEE